MNEQKTKRRAMTETKPEHSIQDIEHMKTLCNAAEYHIFSFLDSMIFFPIITNSMLVQDCNQTTRP